MTNRILHFTLGPVQGFISDARRTRDLWAGSFLLSWLSGQAMVALEDAGGLDDQGGKIIFPSVENDELLAAIRAANAKKSVPSNPYIGSIPNRFKADVSNVKGNAGEICQQAIRDSWLRLSDDVWETYVADVARHGDGTKNIWDRQVQHFWEMNWVVGDDDGDDGQWLDMRKNWRNSIAPDEPGDLCRLMGRYQELSGYHRIGSRDKQSGFWSALSEVDGIGLLDLQKDERLCAIALIKRLFPLRASEILGWTPRGDVMRIRNWPSVSYVAAVPWLKAAAVKMETKGHSGYWETAHENISDSIMGEYHTELFDLPKNGFFKLDGHLFFKDGIDAWPEDGLKGNKNEARKALKDGLADVEKTIGEHASEFYAILLMDGDSIGSRIRDHANIISPALSAFTSNVHNYFHPDQKPNNPSNGVLIYAGGDDVLALVPVDTAIDAASALQAMYRSAFIKAGEPKDAKPFTLSGAIVFAQYKIPLQSVLRTAHHYLDDIAKDQNGRNSLALAVMKPGGISSDWVSSWDIPDAITSMIDVAQRKSEYSSSFFYNLRDRYAPLFDQTYRVDAAENANPVLETDGNLFKTLIRAEYMKGKNRDQLTDLDISSAVDKIYGIATAPKATKGAFDFNAALVARFMSVEGRWGLMSADKEKVQE